MILSRDFKEFIELLNRHDVQYLVVGGYAVAYHGHPRYTKDMDVWIEASLTNAARLQAALDEFGFGSLGIPDWGRCYISYEQNISYHVYALSKRLYWPVFVQDYCD
jgi:hypothetical protein